jgi:hypothetical protein
MKQGFKDYVSVQATPRIVVTARWTLDQLLGYIDNWSAVQACRRSLGEEPLASVAEDLSRAWGETRLSRQVTCPLSIRLGGAPLGGGLPGSA